MLSRNCILNFEFLKAVPELVIFRVILSCNDGRSREPQIPL
jgi:hypothetical protein